MLLCGDCMCVCEFASASVRPQSCDVTSCDCEKLLFKKKMRRVMGCGEQHHMPNVTLVTVRFSSEARTHTVRTSVHNLHKHTSWVMTEGKSFEPGD